MLCLYSNCYFKSLVETMMRSYLYNNTGFVLILFGLDYTSEERFCMLILE